MQAKGGKAARRPEARRDPQGWTAKRSAPLAANLRPALSQKN